MAKKDKKKLYTKLNYPLPIRLNEENSKKMPEIIEFLGCDNRNQAMNWIIDYWRLAIEIRDQLIEKGTYNLNQETAKKFRIRLV